MGRINVSLHTPTMRRTETFLSRPDQISSPERKCPLVRRYQIRFQDCPPPLGIHNQSFPELINPLIITGLFPRGDALRFIWQRIPSVK